jgi:hypothetical protein
MTSRRLLAVALIAAAGAALTQSAAGNQQRTVAAGAGRVAVVLGGRAASDPTLLARAGALTTRAHGADVQLRIARTPTEELAVTHVLAVEGYDAVVGLDLDRTVSVAPVARRFPHVRFVSARPATLAAVVRAQTEPRFRLR